MSRPTDIPGWILRPLVNLFGPASRAAVPYSNRIMNKHPTGRSQEPIVLNFHSVEGKREVQRWHRMQRSNTRFTSLEYRKQKEGTFKHEFIVVRLDDSICRFDRRAREDVRGHALKDEGTQAEDSAQIIPSSEQEYGRIMEQSDVLLRIEIPQGEDLRLILAVCYGIQRHPQAGSYSLLRYNCYFFSWTIVTAVARRASKWESAMTPVNWNGVVQTSLRFISPVSAELNPPEREQTKRRFVNSRRARNSPVPALRQDEWSRAHFQEELRLQLQSFRPFVADTLRELLLSSQLAHRLGEQLRQHSTDALLKARANAAQESAATAAMRHVSDTRSKPKEPQKYGDLTWQKHCDIAWEVASNAAYASNAAALAEEHHPKRDGREIGVYDGRNLRSWEEEWDNIWNGDWSARIPPRSSTNYNKELGASASRKGKDAWRVTWRNATELRDRHLSHIAQKVASTLLDYLGKLETAQRIQVAGRPGFLSNADLQQYIRRRMQNHFERVDKFGFGKFDELLHAAEHHMCQIWVKAVEGLEGDMFDGSTN